MLVETPIEDLMDQLHTAILTADYPALAALSPAVETALAALMPVEDASFLARLRKKAERNAACAQAAGRGVRAAIRRLAEVQQNTIGLMTYDENGNRTLRNGATEVTRRL